MKDETNLFIACDFIHGLLECYQTPCPILQSSISNIVILRKYSSPSHFGQKDKREGIVDIIIRILFRAMTFYKIISHIER